MGADEVIVAERLEIAERYNVIARTLTILRRSPAAKSEFQFFSQWL